MKDQYSRNIHYMRISLTDRCNFRCSYCLSEYMPLKHQDILSYEDILTICQSAIQLGITHFKVTGGEPFARKDALSFICSLKSLPGCKQVTITTNGSLLNEQILDQLKELSIDGINISLDTLNDTHFQTLTKSKSLQTIIKNIKYAKKIGLPLKINTVLYNDVKDDLLSLCQFAFQYHIPIRFIELMPTHHQEYSLLTSIDVIDLLKQHHTIIPSSKQLGNGPAHYYIVDDEHYIGFIEPIHGKFCNACNRVRLTSTGYLKTCLFHSNGIQLKPYLSSDHLTEIIKQTIYKKPKNHSFETTSVDFSMNEIGG